MPAPAKSADTTMRFSRLLQKHKRLSLITCTVLLSAISFLLVRNTVHIADIAEVAPFSDAENADTSALGNSVGSAASIQVKQEKCHRSIHAATDKVISAVKADFAINLGVGEKKNIIDLIAKAAMDPKLKGDWVEVDGSSTNLSTASRRCDVGKASFVAALAQRAALRELACGSDGKVQTRAIYLALEDKICGEAIKQLFQDHTFAVKDTKMPLEKNDLAATDDVPVYLLKGHLADVLPDSQIGDIALLRLNAGDDAYSSTLLTLFSLFRRIRINGYVIINHYDQPSCQKAIGEFLAHGHVTLRNVKSSTARWFQKTNNRVRIPRRFKLSVIKQKFDQKLEKAWVKLLQWHKDVGVVMSWSLGHTGYANPYQVYRFTEAMRHTVSEQKRHQAFKEGKKEARINVCETGFNGGHSAMLFLSFLDRQDGANVHYYGWTLEDVKVSVLTAKKMKETYEDNFHIVWGDSKQTLKDASSDMRGEKCHLIVVDGDHSKEGVFHDIENFLQVAKPGAIVFADDLAPSGTTGVPLAGEMLRVWMDFVAQGKLISVANYWTPYAPSPGFVEGIVPGSDGGYTLGL